MKCNLRLAKVVINIYTTIYEQKVQLLSPEEQLSLYIKHHKIIVD